MAPAPAVRQWIVDSDVDAKTTMLRMAKLCTRAMLDTTIIRDANEIIAAEAPRDLPAQIEAIRQYMQVHFRFVDNPVGVQLIRDPGSMLADIGRRGFTQGACDDAAVLVATLGMANGIPARFTAYAFGVQRGETIFYHDGTGAFCTTTRASAVPYSHVIASLYDGTLQDGSDWELLDVTRPADIARLPESVRTLTVDVS